MEYGDLDKGYNHLKFSLVRRFLEEEGIAGEGIDLLDLGGYNGVLKRFLPSKVNYFLTDRDDGAISMARDNGIANAEVADVDRVPILKIFNRKFDVIVICDLLDLVVDPVSIIKQVSEGLKPGAAVIISVTNDNTIYHRMRVFLGKGINKTPFNHRYHLRHPTFAQWRDFLGGYFQVRKCRYWICFDKEQGKFRDAIFLFLAEAMPSLFARGGVFLCRKGDK